MQTMLKIVSAENFYSFMGSGKTRPSLMGCNEISIVDGNAHAANEREIDLVVKLSAGPERKTVGLVAEVIFGSLAADLDLPVPQPYLVNVSPEFVEAVPNAEFQALARRSSEWAFGSEKLPGQYSTVSSFLPLSEELRPFAAEILVFDALIVNEDRRISNPNCLCNGRQLAIYDHELCCPEGLLFWRPPWEDSDIRFPVGPAQHIFLDTVRKQPLNLERLQNAFAQIKPQRIDEYCKSLPSDWNVQDASVVRMIEYVKQLIAHAPRAIQNISSALS